QGKQIYKPPQPDVIREYVREEIKKFTPEVKALEQPSVYPVCMEKRLTELRTHLVKSARK
ncbi:MAG TPA: nicotinate phosphoribosyltransferase, partial [Verrucomicrobiota bacterium]|nr:nicotinate phosphoribosyltransferase [Verrucomicrobiota bacterium]